MTQTESPARPPYPFFSEAGSEEAVNARMGADIDPRLRQIMTVVIKHLHAAAKEIEPSHEEWLQAIRFLTEVGQMCTDWRQEMILLSDVLGVTMLVDAINHRRPSTATENTILGPFYVENAPAYANGTNICLDGRGEPMLVHGRVLDLDGQPIAGAKIDAWQTNDDGFYDVQQRGVQPDWNLRGLFTAEVDGRYWFRSVKPRYYPIPSDGPVGRMLGALGRQVYRAAHIHFIVTAPGCETVITHIFEPNCPYLAEDAVFGVKDSLIGRFERVEESAAFAQAGFDEPYWSVEWDFLLDRPASDADRIR